MSQEDENVTNVVGSEDNSMEFSGMKILQLLIASVGVITNIIVVVVFLNDRKMRKKIPNICIINQVCLFLLVLFTDHIILSTMKCNVFSYSVCLSTREATRTARKEGQGLSF